MYSVGIIKVMWPFLSEMGAVLALPVVDQYLRERDDCFLLKWCHCADHERVTSWLLSILNMETGIMNHNDGCLMKPGLGSKLK